MSDPNTVMKNVDGVIQIVRQDVRHTQEMLTDLQKQIQRVSYAVKLDEKEFAVGEWKSRAEATRATSNLVNVVEKLVAEKHGGFTGMVPHVMVEGLRERTVEQEKTTRKNVARISRLYNAKRTTTPRCKCGKHKGISFIEDKTTIEEDMCPLVWWLECSRLAFERKHPKYANSDEFTKAVPLASLLKEYSL